MTQRIFRLALTLVLSSAAFGCGFKVPDRTPPTNSQIEEQQGRRFADKPAIRRIKLPANMFLTRSVHESLPDWIAEQPFKAYFPDGEATLGDLVELLDLQEIPVINLIGTTVGGVGIPEEAGDGSDTPTAPPSFATEGTLSERRLPFRRFEGTLYELFALLRKSMNITVWWEDNTLYINDKDTFTVAVPQNDDVIGDIEDGILDLGAEDVFSSIAGGQIVYTAAPSINDRLVQPFFRRIAGNLSEITLQVAVVTIGLNDSDNTGFDWSSFSLQFDNVDPADSANSSPANASNPEGVSININNQNLSLTRIAKGEIFGIRGAVGVSGALLFLSNFGRTENLQTVELRTLAGQQVNLTSGQEIPYVSDISSTTTGDTVTGAVDFDTVQTGLTLDFTPYFDATTDIITMEVEISLNSVVDFVEVSSGTAGQTVRQPITDNRDLSDIVRVRTGETVILGGVRLDQTTDSRNAPLGAFEYGARRRSSSTSTLFFVIRPIVTIYETADLGQNPTNGKEGKAYKQGLDLLAPAAPLPPGMLPQENSSYLPEDDGQLSEGAMPAAAPGGNRLRRLFHGKEGDL